LSNLIQIKRSLNTPIPTTLANGELAYTANGNVLYIGSNGAIEAIGGKRTPGVLTANQALVANTTSGIDKVIAANLVAYSITANGSVGANGFILAVDASGNTYWQDPNDLQTSAAGSNGQVQFNGGTNDLTASDGFVFTAAANNLTVGNTVISARLNVANGSFTANATNLTVAPGVTLTSNGSTGSLGEVLTSNGAGVYWATPVTTLDGLSDVSASTAANNDLLVYNAATSQWENKAAGNGVEFTAQSLAVKAGTGITVNTSGVHVTPRNIALTGDVSGNATYDGSGNVSITVAIEANSVALGTDTTGDYVANLVSGAGISVGTASGEGSSPTIDVVANTGVTANSSGVFIGQPVGTTDAVQFQDLNVTGNTTIGSNFQDVVDVNARIGSDLTPNANNQYYLGTNDLRWLAVHAANVHSEQGYFSGSVSVGGDLIVTGNVVTQNVSSVQISDPLIYLAGNNYVSDLVDIGFVGNYYDGVNQRHAGLIRHAADDQFYIFQNYLPEPDDNVIHVSNTATEFQLAVLNAYIHAGALTANSTEVSILANSSIAVDIAANTLSLSAPLPATSGGIGQNSYTLGDILVASNTTYISKLGVGTEGKILQSNGSTVVYADLDGGSF
jgi:hypothetical protein